MKCTYCDAPVVFNDLGLKAFDDGELKRLQWFSAESPPDVDNEEIIVCRKFANGNRLVSSFEFWRGREHGTYWKEVTHWMPMPNPPKESVTTENTHE